MSDTEIAGRPSLSSKKFFGSFLGKKNRFLAFALTTREWLRRVCPVMDRC
ncbi:MAG: hypothetical protein ACYCZB_10580 [Acidiphilium sp.]